MSGNCRNRVGRRRFLAGMAGLAAAPALSRAAIARPWIVDGITAGDVTADSAVIWAHADRIARMVVEWTAGDNAGKSVRVSGPTVTARTGYTGQTIIGNLPSGADITYRVNFETPDGKVVSEPASGRLRTPGAGRDLSFVFGGDQCGSGWGINPDWGGLRMFETMLKTRPDLLIHLGDRIYADRPMNESVILGEAEAWTNIVTPAKKKVAETLDEFRGNYSYNFVDGHYRRFAAEVPMIATWDDHEVTDDWWPGQQLTRRIMQRKGYIVSSVDKLAENGRQAFFDYTPMRRSVEDPGRIHRQVSHGPLADFFMLDTRSYRGPNGRNREPEKNAESAMLGRKQVEWLKSSLAKSTAVWKFIGNSVPIAHARNEEQPRYDKWANRDNGPPLGREMELAEILSAIRTAGVQNVVWLAADVHYSAAHHFSPDRAAFKHFDPFWEFIAGPFHTRPGRVRHLDGTFGPERHFRTALSPEGNTPPSDGHQYFGHVQIDGRSADATVSIRDLTGKTLYQTLLKARR